jgi:hypothetical protein|tara:strand:- start:585 stop:1205 length:621 start_codon:yes stop_codon:yes gene_type:complete
MQSAVHISKMTGKLDGFKAISTNTRTNKFCLKMNEAKKETICTHCYSHTMLKGFRKNMAPALQRNSDLLSSRMLARSEIPIILEAFFRFSAHGELINMQHLINLVEIAVYNPHCTFSLWTKRKDFIKRLFDYQGLKKPANLILIYSNPKIGSIIKDMPKYFDKTFNNVLENEFTDDQNCTGQQCKNCLLCYKHNTTNIIVEKVKAY